MDKKTRILFGLFVIGYLVTFFFSVPTGTIAKPGQYSKDSNYKNNNPIKEDFFKNIFVFTILFYVYDPAFIGKPLIDFENIHETIIGKAAIIGILCGLYHIYMQPILNLVPFL